MAIKKHEEIRLNVKPIFLTLYHEYVFEGPCRFGEGIQLEKEFDRHMAAEKFKGWYAQLQAAMPENVVNLLEPVKVERDENFLTKDEMIDKLEANLRKVNSVSHMVEHGLDAKGIIAELLQGFAVDYLTTTDLAFRCQCSKERISEVLLSLGKTDLESLIEDGHAEVCCHFCNERYEFSKEELQAIYDKAMANRSHAEA